MLPNVSILALLPSEPLAADLTNALQGQRYSLSCCQTEAAFLTVLREEGRTTDCLIIEAEAALPSLFAALRSHNILLPTVIWSLPGQGDRPSAATAKAGAEGELERLYHHTEVRLAPQALETIGDRIDSAIKQFLQLSPQDANLAASPPVAAQAAPSTAALLEQQQRLAHKLKERLGYLGVYYKRNPDNFYRSLGPDERQELMADLTQKYQVILLAYFREDAAVNVQIDEFVNLAFFTDISVTQIVEIHMKLIDDYSKQLKLEGRNEEVLINYRLTLLDIISHLCEMYRRSIPRNS